MKSVRTINQYYQCSAHLKDIVDSWYTALYAPHFPSVHLHQPLVSIPSVDQLIFLIFNFLTLPSTRNSLSNNLKAQAILNKILSIQFQCIYVHDAPFLKSQHSLGAILCQDPTIRIRKDFFWCQNRPAIPVQTNFHLLRCMEEVLSLWKPFLRSVLDYY